jgi:integrase/recombinase XerD
MDVNSSALADRWPLLASCPETIAWLVLQTDLGLAPRTLEAYARGLAEYLGVCKRDGKDPVGVSRAE